MSPLIWDLGHIAKFEELWLVKDGTPGGDGGREGENGEGGDGLEGAADGRPGRESDAEESDAHPEEESDARLEVEADGRSEATGDAGGSRAGSDVVGEGLGMYDAIANPRATRGRLALPDRGELLRELRRVRQRSFDRLDEDPLDPADPLHAEGFVYHLVAQHEAQHQETMLQALGLVSDLRYEPVFRESPGPARYTPDTDLVVIPAGPFPLGTGRTPLAYDNEQPLHWVELEAFGLDVAPVSNRAHLAFLEDGGYRRPELWSKDGWAWRQTEGVEHPGAWARDAAGGWVERRFGRVRPLALNRPVVHVSWYEADAHARWAGKRLPTEAEWEKAASWDVTTHAKRLYPWGDEAPTAEHANLDQSLFGPAEIGAYPRGRSFYGCHQMIGDVWEWTASDFLPYPGFRSFPYREYSEIFFGSEYKVLRGGSWATSSIVARNTFRNWDYPIRRQIFAGFRCAVDV
jgi:iron(II)-dependent oxidoreductase